MTARLCLHATALATIATTSIAQTETALEPLVIRGNGLETTVLESPASVTVVDGEALRQVVPESVGSFLASIPGVLVEEDGIERIRIRGETARRVQVKIDGQALTDHSGYGQPLLVDPLNIERIEVVRGASSVTQGSNAIGGVVNIITKRGAPDRAAELTVQGGYFGGSDGYRASASLGGTLGDFDYRVTAGGSNLDDRKTPEGTLEPSGRDDQNAAVHLGYQITPNQYIAFKAQKFDLSADVYSGDDDFLLDLPKRDLEKFALFYEADDLTPWMSRLTFDTYRQTVDREFTTDITVNTGSDTPFEPSLIESESQSNDTQTTWGANLAAEFALFDIGRTYAGLQYENDKIDADRDSATTVTLNPLPFPPGMDPIVAEETVSTSETARIQTTSAYIQQELKFGDDITAYLGGRYYDVDAELEKSSQRSTQSNDDSRFLGNVAVVWTPYDDTAFRASFAQGYSYPTLGQLFLETTVGEDLVVGNPDLAPETADTFEIGGRWNGPGTLIDATAFYTMSEDYIAYTSTSTGLTYDNVDEATSYGLELYAETRVGSSDFRPYISGSYIIRELDFGNGYTTKDSGTPELFGRIGVKYDWSAWGMGGVIDAYARGESATELRDEDGAIVQEGDGFTVLDIDAEIALTDNASLTIGLNNLFDLDYDPIDRLPGVERSLDVFLTMTF